MTGAFSRSQCNEQAAEQIIEAAMALRDEAPDGSHTYTHAQVRNLIDAVNEAERTSPLAHTNEVALDDIGIPFSEALDLLEVLRLTPIYALLNSADEDELGEDFKPHKWTGYEREHAEKATALYRILIAHMQEQTQEKHQP